MDQAVYRHLHGSNCQSACSSCNLREICLPAGLTKEEMGYIDRRLVATRRRVPRGAPLYRAGDPFESVYAIWTGFFKTCLASADGREQVTGFQMNGELLGMDGIASSSHEVDAIALEDSQVCVIRYEELKALAVEVDSLQQQFHRIMSHEIVRNQGVMLLLGSMYAEERLAAFLLNLVHRLRVRGYSATAVALRMTRDEIASFLGLSVETVSRTFTKFQVEGLLFVRNRQIRITDPLGLQHVIDGSKL